MSVSVGRGNSPTTACNAIFDISEDYEGPFQTTCGYFEEEWSDFTRTKTELIQVARRRGAATIEATTPGSYQIETSA